MNISKFNKNKIITSYGIALVRNNNSNINIHSNLSSHSNNLANGTLNNSLNNSLNYEILFIKKRLSYAYISFIKGIYNKNNDNEILKLLNNMTIDEKFCLLSLNFNIIWYKSYLNLPYNNLPYNNYSYNNCSYNNYSNGNSNLTYLNKFEKYKNKFEKNFLYDGGKRLNNLIKQSKSTKKLWEIPKGMNNNNESGINAAIREFSEETNIKKNKYKLLYNIDPIIYIFTDENITYKYVYYIGIMLDNKYIPRIELHNNLNMIEIADMQFFNIENLRIINKNHKFINLCKKVIKIAKLYF